VAPRVLLTRVRISVLAYVSNFPAGAGYFEAVEAARTVGSRFGLDLDTICVADRVEFLQQVKGVLDSLADERALVRVGNGEVHPSGATVYSVCYYPVRNYAQAHRNAVDQQAERKALAARWGVVRNVLTDIGFPVSSLPGQPITMELADWEHLADVLRCWLDSSLDPE
jgi:hypothetical protein